MTTAAVTTLADGFRFTEGPRWHAGALSCSDMHDHRVVRIADGVVSTIAVVDDDEPSGLGWLPDGRMLIVAMETQRLLRVEADGSMVTHIDLSDVARGSLNDMIVGSDGTAYVGDMGARIHEPAGRRQPGQTFQVDAFGRLVGVVDDLASPNGHALTDDGRTLIVAESAAAQLTAFDVADDGSLSGRRIFATLNTPTGRRAVADGICLDAHGAVWYADPINASVVRVLEGGAETDRIEFDGVIAAACVLGGPERTTMFVCVAGDWRRDVVRATRTGRIDAFTVAVTGVGRP